MGRQTDEPAGPAVLSAHAEMAWVTGLWPTHGSADELPGKGAALPSRSESVPRAACLPPGQATLRAARSRRGPEVRRASSRGAHRGLFFTSTTHVVSVDDDLGWGQIRLPQWGHFQTPNTAV